MQLILAALLCLIISSADERPLESRSATGILVTATPLLTLEYSVYFLQIVKSTVKWNWLIDVDLFFIIIIIITVVSLVAAEFPGSQVGRWIRAVVDVVLL